MKTVLTVFLMFYTSILSAQVSMSCAYGNLESVPATLSTFEPGASVDIDFLNNEIIFDVTLVEPQGGGGGLPENQLLAELTIVFSESGRYFMERELFPFPWPSCLSMTARLNNLSVSWLAMKNDGIIVEEGDELVISLELTPSSCSSGNFEATLSNFRLEVDCVYGCTYPSASNFDPAAMVDDGSCAIAVCEPTPDLNGDGVVNTADLIELLSLFGSVVPG